jgi:5-formyltetrahydrofolate cyclo-ligase
MNSTDPVSLLAEQKKQMRARMSSLRLVVDQKDGPDAAMAAMRHFLAGLADFGIGTHSIVAGYWPISTEIDPRPIIGRLDDRGITCALPAVQASGEPLVFRRWRPIDPLEDGPFETRQPVATAPAVRPDVMLVPLLAVDAAGWRLGYGAGYYDRTCVALRRSGPLTTIGIGYFIQAVERVPHGDHDVPLDWILTDRGLARAAR